MILVQSIKDFINAQPDDRPVNMWEGRTSDPTGCVLVHYASANNIPIPIGGVGF